MTTALKRIIKSGFVAFWRNSLVSVASILVMVVTLLVIGWLILANAFFQATIIEVEKRVDISVSMKTDASDTDILALKKTIEDLPTVEKVDYLSRDQELEDFIERHKDNSLIIQSLEEVGNPFGARLNIMASDPASYDSIDKFLRGDEALSAGGETIIDHISFKKNVVDRLVALVALIKRVGSVAALLLACISILVTINTISLAIYASREEIGVMRLVGASNAYVQGPFVVEGMISGGLAGLIATLIMYPMAVWVKNTVATLAIDINVASYYVDNFGQILIMLVGGGIILGMIASFLAVRDQIKI